MTKLQDMNKQELLEAIDTLNQCCQIFPEELPLKREDVPSGDIGCLLWDRCVKYREPLIDYLKRNYPPRHTYKNPSC